MKRIIRIHEADSADKACALLAKGDQFRIQGQYTRTVFLIAEMAEIEPAEPDQSGQSGNTPPDAGSPVRLDQSSTSEQSPIRAADTD